MTNASIPAALEPIVARLSQDLKLSARQVTAVAILLEEGATVPFIARYRKEWTGSLDEVAITGIRDGVERLKELGSRREAILKSLAERNLLNETLRGQVNSAKNLSELEDLYLPFRPKRRTKATIAMERGLEPLADILWQQSVETDPKKEAGAFVDSSREVTTPEEALAGARDILAERISDDKTARGRLRELFWSEGIITSKVLTGKEAEGAKFQDYFEWSEPVRSAPSHRVLAMRRGETEGFLLLRMQPAEEDALRILRELFVQGAHPSAEQVGMAAEDSYRRLLKFSMEGETRVALKKKADEEAIRVFAGNMRELLLASPLGQKRVLAIDPGFRTGCKVVCLDAQGKLLHHDVIYPETGRAVEAARTLLGLVQQFKIEAVAIGNGTAGRETESFVRSLRLPSTIVVVQVNESGASIYSASEVARAEFPDLDLTVRGAVSIGRRLMDPLAELVKIDPKSIGVGQYQHDVDPQLLKRSLDDTVASCVNAVGVEVNTASAQLLGYVSGLNSQIAQNIVAYRDANGPFSSREQLKEVPRLGPKAFEQAAGFLRIQGGAHPLDASAVHPERYPTVEKMAADLGCAVADLLQDPRRREKIRPEQYVEEQLGLPTLMDILAELAKPGRDPRQQFEVFSFAEDVSKPADLKPGMKLPGVVTNVTAFGAFVDVGVHQDGLVHISQLSDGFVQAPSEVVKAGQRVEVTVLEVDLERNRIALSMKSNPDTEAPRRSQRNSNESSRPPQQRGEVRNNSRSDGRFPIGGDWFSQAMSQAQKTKK